MAVVSGEKVMDIKGMLIGRGFICVQKKKNAIGESGDYFYNIAFTTAEGDILQCTAGKVADSLELFKPFVIGFNYVERKLKVVDIKPL